MARKPARRMSEIPPDVLAELNAGRLETGNLVEGLAVDFAVLLRAAAPDLSGDRLARVEAAAAVGIVARMALVGDVLHDQFGPAAYARFAAHPSDTVRGWAAYVLAIIPKMTLKQRLDAIKLLADDPHFGVREWAWLAVRPRLAADVNRAVKLLTPWTKHRSTNIRRFAVESTRPRGVWTAHIGELKDDPELGRPLLDPVRADAEKYVRDSVANWLNDASKTRPEWVRALCQQWLSESDDAGTKFICQRALRSMTSG